MKQTSNGFGMYGIGDDAAKEARAGSGNAAAALRDDRTGSLIRAAALLRAIAGGGRAGVALADLVRRTDLPRPTIHRVCQTLEELGWIERDEVGKRFYLGAEMAMLGLSAQHRHSMETIAGPTLAELGRELEQTVYLTVRSGDDSVCAARFESEAQIRTLVLEVGSRQPLGVGAGSMSLLAVLPLDEIEGVIARNMVRYRERFAFDEETFRAGLELARERRYAEHEGLFTRGLSGIGVPVVDSSGYPLAAISTAFISDWLDAEQRQRCALRMEAASRELARRLTGFKTRRK